MNDKELIDWIVVKTIQYIKMFSAAFFIYAPISNSIKLNSDDSLMLCIGIYLIMHEIFNLKE